MPFNSPTHQYRERRKKPVLFQSKPFAGCYCLQPRLRTMRQQRKTSTHAQAKRKAKYRIIKSASVLTTEKLSVFRPASPRAHGVTKAMTINVSDPLSEDNMLCLVRTARTAAASNHPIKPLTTRILPGRELDDQSSQKGSFYFQVI